MIKALLYDGAVPFLYIKGLGNINISEIQGTAWHYEHRKNTYKCNNCCYK